MCRPGMTILSPLTIKLQGEVLWYGVIDEELGGLLHSFSYNHNEQHFSGMITADMRCGIYLLEAQPKQMFLMK